MNKLSTTEVGKNYELLALDLLKKDGYKLVTKNFYSQQGEIDLVMEMANNLVFVEVRSRQSLTSAIESVTPAKQKKIIQTSMQYIQHNQKYIGYTCRFDVIVFNHKNECQWLQNAFETY